MPFLDSAKHTLGYASLLGQTDCILFTTHSQRLVEIYDTVSTRASVHGITVN